MLTSRAPLEHRREYLLALKDQRPLEQAELHALGECLFRLALLRDTTPAESIRTLHQLLALDPINAKVTFHLARLYFSVGAFTQAREWLIRALMLAPTSHRVWTLVSLLQWELQRTYDGNVEFTPNDLRNKGDRVVNTVLDGADELDGELLRFRPSMSQATKEKAERQAAREGGGIRARLRRQAMQDEPPISIPRVPRLTGAGRCRWSGANDVLLERYLENEPSQRTLEQILPMLERAANLAGRRLGGCGAYATLATQWLVAGYPVTTVRRLTRRVQERWSELASSPSLATLDLVCTIFEAPREQAPRLLGAAVAQKRLPLVVASIIHARYVLGPPRALQAGTVFRKARRLVARRQSTDSAASQALAMSLSKKLVVALDELVADPPRELRDMEPREDPSAAHINAATLQTTLEDVVERADRLSRLRDELFAFANTTLRQHSLQEAGEAARSQARAAVDTVHELLRLAEAVSQAGLEFLEARLGEIGRLSGSGRLGDTAELLDQCRNNLRHLGSLGKFGRLLKRIEKSLVGVDRAADPSDNPTLLEAQRRLKTDHLYFVGSSSVVAEAELSLENCLERHVRAMQELKDAQKALVVHLRTVVPPIFGGSPSPDQVAVAKAESAAAGRLLDQLREIGERTLDELGALTERAAQQSELPDDFPERLEAVRNESRSLLQTGAARRSLRTIDQKLAKAAASEDVSLPDSSPLTALRTAIERHLPDVEEPTSQKPEKMQGGAPPSAKEELRAIVERGPVGDDDWVGVLSRAIAKAEETVDQHFGAALATFLDYSVAPQAKPPLFGLWATQVSLYATSCYRIGRFRHALRAWQRLIQCDGFDAPILRNIALSQIFRRDRPAAQNAWERYLAALYWRDLTMGRLSPSADARIQTHAMFSGSTAPWVLAAPLDGQWAEKIDPDEAVVFARNRDRVSNFVSQKLLELANLHVRGQSSLIRLGVTREDAESAREEARDRLVEFSAVVGEELPGRLKSIFPDRLVALLDRALESTSESDNLLRERDPTYDAEHEAHEAALVRFASLKVKIYRLFINPEVSGRLGSLDFLIELVRLDGYPLDLSESLSNQISGKLGIPMETLARLMHLIGQSLVVDLLRFFMTEQAEVAKLREQTESYHRLVQDWSKQESFKEFIPIADNAAQFYPDEMRESMEAAHHEGVSKELFEAVESRHTRFPAFCSVAADYSELLRIRGRFQDAIEVLRRAGREGLSEEGRRQCSRSAAQLETKVAHDNLDNSKAYASAMEYLDLDRSHVAWVRHCFDLFRLAAESADWSPDYDDFRSRVSAWILRAREGLQEWRKDNPLGTRPPVDAHEIDEVERGVSAAVVSVKCSRMLALFNRAVRRMSPGSTTIADDLEIRRLADEVQSHGKPNEVDLARRVLERLDDVATAT